MAISFQEWLDIVREEYLQEFIRLGGAAVKFLIPLGGSAIRSIRARIAEGC